MSPRCMLATGAVLLLISAAAPAAEPPSREDLLNMIQALQDRNQALEKRIQDLETKVQDGAPGQGLTRQEVRQLVEEMLAESRKAMMPGWLDNLTFSGDLRLRYEWRQRASEQRDDDARARFRLRFGVAKKWPAEDLEVVFRIVTGADDDPTSTNQTFEDMFEEHLVGVDTAYARWTPKAVPGLALTGGKMPLPWQTTDMVWDSDVRPEGGWVAYRVPRLGPAEPFVGAGLFQLTYDDAGLANEGRPEATLGAYEAGVALNMPGGVVWTTAATLYDYNHIQDAFAPGGTGGNFFRNNPRGNTVIGGVLAAGDFQILDLTSQVAFQAVRMPWVVTFDWAHNTDNEDPSDRSDGLAVGVKAGANKKKGDWSFAYIYKYVEADATLAFFADTTYGGTNRKGHQWTLTYSFSPFMVGALNLFATQPIEDDLYPEWERTRFTFQADLIWKF